MRRHWRLVGLGVHWVLLAFLIFAPITIIETQGGAEASGEALRIGILLPTLVLGIALMAMLLWDALHNPRLSSGTRAVWGIVIFVFYPLAMPVYWWKYMYRGP